MVVASVPRVSAVVVMLSPMMRWSTAASASAAGMRVESAGGCAGGGAGAPDAVGEGFPGDGGGVVAGECLGPGGGQVAQGPLDSIGCGVVVGEKVLGEGLVDLVVQLAEGGEVGGQDHGDGLPAKRGMHRGGVRDGAVGGE
ncbi:hypothetical protein OG754_00610 [Streptomyces decoyicus]|uniref:hypothetical protein n=1 Tax=Streptomyces decoyicus TaxID=249567 RepID=UPI002E34408C|nr:hypothetical protein [Streptomyces decoyicus]